MIEQINKSKPQFYSEDEYYVRPKAAEKKIKIAQTMFQTVINYLKRIKESQLKTIM